MGELTERLKQLDLDKHTLLVLTSDHGELLFSHPADFLTSAHSVALYDPVIHVPLILWGAGLPAGHVVNALASNVDQAPTILDLAGLPPLPGVQGRSLTPVVEGNSHPAIPTCLGSRWPPARAVGPLAALQTDPESFDRQTTTLQPGQRSGRAN